MTRRIILGLLIVAVLLVGAAGVGVTAYRIGMAQGLADSGRFVAPEIDGAPVPGYPFYGGFYHRPFGFGPWGWGFGFGFLQCLVPLFLFFLFFSLLRGLFGWRRPWGWGGHHHGPGPWGKGVPPMFEEWHKQAHGQAPPPETPPSDANK